MRGEPWSGCRRTHPAGCFCVNATTPRHFQTRQRTTPTQGREKKQARDTTECAGYCGLQNSARSQPTQRIAPQEAKQSAKLDEFEPKSEKACCAHGSKMKRLDFQGKYLQKQKE